MTLVTGTEISNKMITNTPVTGTKIPFKTIADTLQTEVSIESLPVRNHKKIEKIKILDLTFSDFHILNEKLNSVRWHLKNAKDKNNARSVKLGTALAVELSKDIQNVSTEISNVCEKCSHMLKNLDTSSAPQINFAKKVTTSFVDHYFHLKTEADAVFAIEALKSGKIRLEHQFLKDTNTDQIDFMQVFELQNAFKELSPKPIFNSKSKIFSMKK